jgi:hypothetical protein
MDELLEDMGVDPYRTPTDNLPLRAQWAIARDILEQQGVDPNE